MQHAGGARQRHTMQHAGSAVQQHTMQHGSAGQHAASSTTYRIHQEPSLTAALRFTEQRHGAPPRDCTSSGATHKHATAQSCQPSHRCSHFS
eukprot:222582-Chlamydomonas_euryale.AAC.8